MKETKRRTHKRFLTYLSGSLVIFMALVVVSSCKSSKSVKDVKSRQGFNVYKNRAYNPTAPKDVLTRRLFMQNRRADISLPQRDGMQVDPTTGAVVVSEDVTFTNADNHTGYFDNSDLQTDTVYSLKEVTIEARSRFTPEHDGQINVDFVIDVPKQLVSADWRIKLQPKLIDNDSIVELPPLIVKGKNFQQKQLHDYATFDGYVHSIIDTAAYDSVFLDKEGIRHDIMSRQQFYYDKYYKEWNRQVAYERWKIDTENKNERYMARQLGLQRELYHKYSRMANEDAMRAVAYGKDTTGTFARYMDRYKKEVEFLPDQWSVTTALKRIPPEFQDLYEQDRSFANIYNDVMTNVDSMNIARNRYFFDLIAENELKKARVDDREKELIPYPWETGIKDSVIVEEGEHVKYLYKQSYPTRIGLKKLAIVLDGRVNAVDHSIYTIQASDTINYFVASLAQLVDMSLVSSETTVYRDMFSKMTSYLKFAPNKTDFDEFYSDNRAEIDKILETYRTFANDGGLAIDSIELTVSTSLAGIYENNVERTMKRSHAIKEFFERKYAHEMGGTKFIPYYQGEDWNTLAKEIKSNAQIKNRDAILDLLVNAQNPDYTELMVKRKFPSDFKIITDKIYPKLEKTELALHMHRPEMTEESEVRVEEKPDYEKGVQLLLDRDYWAAMDYLANYPDYNTALCLACLGYNAKSLELLEGLKPNGYTEYLLAVLKLRLGKESEAIAHLEEACKLDPSKVFRAELDPEILGLVRKYNLQLGSATADEAIDETASEMGTSATGDDTAASTTDDTVDAVTDASDDSSSVEE